MQSFRGFEPIAMKLAHDKSSKKIQTIHYEIYRTMCKRSLISPVDEGCANLMEEKVANFRIKKLRIFHVMEISAMYRVQPILIENY